MCRAIVTKFLEYKRTRKAQKVFERKQLELHRLGTLLFNTEDEAEALELRHRIDSIILKLGHYPSNKMQCRKKYSQ